MTDVEKAEFEDVIRKLVTKCEELAAENARLRSSENNAHSVLREVYNDPTASPAVRVKAAGLAFVARIGAAEANVAVGIKGRTRLFAFSGSR